MSVSDYFYQLDFNIITPSEKTLLQRFANDHDLTFVDNVSRQGNKDGNQLFPELTNTSNDLLQSIKSRVTLNCRLGMVRQLPNITVSKHTDGSPFRRTVLSIPLLPGTDYTPTYFWETTTSNEPCTQALYIDMNPCLLNTQKVHSVINDNNIRVNLQLCFAEDIAVVREMVINNTLFKQKCYQ
jgi:hypothetical protein